MPEFRPGPLFPWVLLAALLAGCGQKGPLYLPKPQAQAQAQAQSQPPTSEQIPTPRP
jgi:predicted small lipoprotein YifL